MKSITQQPKIALLIPCFNGLQHLPKLLESASKMTRRFDEIVVYDDGSSEPLPFDPILMFPKIKFVQGRVNGGAGKARNELMTLTDADYIHFHDIDDTEIPTGFLSLLTPHLLPDRVVFSSWQTTWLDGSSPTLYDYPEFETVKDFRKYFLRTHIHMNATIFPRKLAATVGFDEGFRAMEDLVFNVRLAQAGAFFYHVGAVVAQHEKNADSTISRMDEKKFRAYQAKYCQRCREVLPEKYHPEIGRIALYYAWDACFQGFDNECKLAIAAARACGTLDYAQFGKAVQFIAPFFGLNNTLKVRRWWFYHTTAQKSLSHQFS